MSDKYGRIMYIDEILKLLPFRVITHMTRVSRITNVLAQKVCCGDKDSCYSDKFESLYFGDAAFYHDIGKSYIPMSVLAKSGRFSKNEFELMKKHTNCAQVIFHDINRGSIVGMPEHLILLARDAAVFHHECWDGNGYPYGISREDIPLVARITSVCDAYDAITNDRIYRTARTHREACDELKACSGTQFDPEIVDAFLKNEKEISCIVNYCV